MKALVLANGSFSKCLQGRGGGGDAHAPLHSLLAEGERWPPTCKAAPGSVRLPRRNAFASMESRVVPGHRARCREQGGVTPGCRQRPSAAICGYGHSMVEQPQCFPPRCPESSCERCFLSPKSLLLVPQSREQKEVEGGKEGSKLQPGTQKRTCSPRLPLLCSCSLCDRCCLGVTHQYCPAKRAPGWPCYA